jgi:hypothetical protein
MVFNQLQKMVFNQLQKKVFNHQHKRVFNYQIHIYLSIKKNDMLLCSMYKTHSKVLSYPQYYMKY